ncbi:MAG: chromosome segregation protein SMC [Promethearchaeota archaeon]|nr:MAG: chromosome segregation protein SMC [Candidatus Lokiarchaeota archaeon]
MVYIKSLICEGFKSFKEKTKINFSKGFTSIVGSNGSGKSNILDAFVFAIGELSGNKMRVNNIKDLICNGGSNGGTPSKYARVDVVFDNSNRNIPIPVESNTVKVSRKIYIDGKGKYFLNDKVITRRELQDILDLAGLLPNSSNLILQGELFRIITMNNNERRGLIEDISGIASYNEKKEKAEKDLAKVEENISRITLLLNELSIQLDSLEKEKDDALKYQDYDIKQKNAENALIVLKLRDFQKQIDRFIVKKETLIKEIQEINYNLLEKRENLSKITVELDKINEEIKKLQTNELKELTLNLNKLKTDIAKKETQKDNFQKEILKLKKNLIDSFKKKEDLEENKKIIQNNLMVKKKEKKEIKEKLHSLKEELYHSEEQTKEFDSKYKGFQENLESLKNDIAEKNEIKSEIKSEIKVLTSKLESSNDKLSNTVMRVDVLNGEIENISQEIKILDSEERNYKEKPDNNISLNDLESNKQNLDLKLKKIQSIINEKHEKLISLKSKIKVIQKLSSNKALEAILRLKNDRELSSKHKISGTIYGTIAQLGKTREEYNTALQIAGGNKFNYIVVENQATAKQCINFLKNNKIGRASFIPLDKIKTNFINYDLNNNEKIIGRAVDLIQFDGLFKKAFEFVFGRTIVVSDIDTASNLDIKARKVTLNGDVVEMSNLMTGGTFKQSMRGGFISQEESKIPKLETELNNLKREEDSYLKKLKNIDKQIALSYKSKISANNELSEVRKNLAVLKDNLLRKEDELKDYNVKIEETKTEIKNIEGKLQTEQLKLKDIDQILSDLMNDENELKSKISLLEDNDFTKKINNLRKKIDELEKDYMHINLEVTKLRTQLEDVINNRESEIESTINNSQEEIKDNTFKLETLKKELVDIETTIKELESELLKKNEVVGQFYSKREELLLSQTKFKAEIEDLKSKIVPKNIKINTLEINLQNIKSQKDEMEENHQIGNEELEKIQNLLSFSKDKLSNIIKECVNIKHQLEPVNMRAIKKYDKIKERYDDLIEKHDIVVDERISILEFIERIELEKKNTFLNTFNGINERFKEIFAKLSPGGEAKLKLENQEDPFAGGVKIIARPGGKKWCLTQSMSGGEKTLTVVALILGIQMAIPSPYYILDEIDAAFDENNANHVASMIKELSEKSQFILITHRDVTMTKTDDLIGVSNVHGLTEVLNLNIREALEQIAQS